MVVWEGGKESVSLLQRESLAKRPLPSEILVLVLSRSVAARLVICVLCVTVFVVLYLLLSPPSVFIVVFDC